MTPELHSQRSSAASRGLRRRGTTASGTRARARPPPRPSAAPGAAPEVTEPPLFSGRKPGRPRGTRGRPGGAGGGGGAAPPPPSRARPNGLSRGNKRVIDREQRPITAGGSELAPAPSGQSRARCGWSSGAPPHSGHVSHSPDGQGCPAPY